jgi:hypothetical protein
MKKYLLIFGLVFGFYAFGQEYSFDHFYEFDVIIKKYIPLQKQPEIKNYKLLILINSKDSSFVFNGNNINKDFEGSLYDFKSKKQHLYSIENDNNDLKIDYKYTEKSTFNDYIENANQFSSSIINNDSSNVQVIKYKFYSPNKQLGKAIIQYNENKNLKFHKSILKLISHSFFDNRKIEFIGDKLPNFISFQYQNNYNISFKLINIKQINTTLEVKK